MSMREFQISAILRPADRTTMTANNFEHSARSADNLGSWPPDLTESATSCRAFNVTCWRRTAARRRGWEECTLNLPGKLRAPIL